MKKCLAFLAFVSFSSVHAEFFVGEGATGSDFLKIPVSARAAALAGSYGAVFGDVGTMEYNPAGLAGTYRNELNASYQVFFEETSLSSLSLATPISVQNDSRNFSSTPFIPKDKVFFGLHYRMFNASDDERNSVGAKTGDFSIKDQLFQASLAYAAFDQVIFGVSGKYIGRRIDDESMSTYAFDFGSIYMVNERLSFGASILNWGQDKAFLDVKDPLPTTLRLGAKWDATRRFSFLSDYAQGRDKISRLSLGSEATVVPFVRLRAGIATAASAMEYTGGLGINFKPSSLQRSAPAKPAPEDESFKKVLEDIDGPSKSAGPKPPSPVEFGLDYAARFAETLGFTHTFTFRILF